jgi:hypothetical protein
MKKITLYHGTSADNAAEILKNGFDGASGRQIWNCSGGLNYFWNPERLAEESGDEDDSEEYKNESAFQRARESAECALVRSKDCRRVVFKLEIPADFYKKHFQDDFSCANMGGAVVCSVQVPASYIVETRRDVESLDFFRSYFASILINHHLAESLSLSAAEKAMAQAVSGDASCEIFEFLSEAELEKVDF